MDTMRLLRELSCPEAYPYPVDQVDIAQTHISLVFLAGAHVWKIKKPVAMGFLDFSSLELREFYCQEEVRLNRRLAPDVYLGVEPITEVNGKLRVGGTGTVVEWAVHMRRLQAADTFAARLRRDELQVDQVSWLGRLLAGFHRRTMARPEDMPHGTFETIARNARENFSQSVGQIGQTVSPQTFERLRSRTEQELARLAPLFRERVSEGRIRETHGDLHLDHVYLESDPQGERLLMIDCIEFSSRYRCADPISDLAFLVMDFAYHGRRDLGQQLCQAYFAGAEDLRGGQLLDFYAAYRAIVRAKVAGLKANEPEVPEQERARARNDAAARWLLALNWLEPPERRPCLLLVGGLPGSGKSTLARGLAEKCHMNVIRSDVVRKQLRPAPASGELYAPTTTERTYTACADQARRELRAAGRVLVDASFQAEGQRQRFIRLAHEMGVPVLFLLAEVDPAVAKKRLAMRKGDASDADWNVRLLLQSTWEPASPSTVRVQRTVNLNGSVEEGLQSARRQLTEAGLDRA